MTCADYRRKKARYESGLEWVLRITNHDNQLNQSNIDNLAGPAIALQYEIDAD